MSSNPCNLRSGPTFGGPGRETPPEAQNGLVDIQRIRSERRIRAFLKSPGYISLVIISSLYALFMDDLRHLLFPKNLDPAFNILTIIIFAFFIGDIALLSAVQRGYFLRVAFWLDLAGGLFLLLDIGWLQLRVVKARQVSIYGKLARGARASKVGLQLVRLWEIVRAFRREKKEAPGEARRGFGGKSEEERERRRAVSSYYANPKLDNLIANELYPSNLPKGNEISKEYLIKKLYLKESHRNNSSQKTDKSEPKTKNLAHPIQSTRISSLGKRFSEKNIERIITIIIILTISIPLFREDTFMISLKSYQSGQNGLAFLLKRQALPLSKELESALANFLQTFSATQQQILYLQVFKKQAFPENDSLVLTLQSDKTISPKQSLARFREYEIFTVSSPENRGQLAPGEFYLLSKFQSHFFETRNAGLNIFRTCLVLFLMIIFSILLHRDANELLIGPFEEMMEKIGRIEENPISAWKENPEAARPEKMTRSQLKGARESADLETSILINTLIQSGKLLALGFGEAGSDIISNFLSPNSERNFKKVFCLYAFCEIRKFQETAEILHGEIIAFVNYVADIVSTISDFYLGSTNKNIGESFLLIWKFDPSEEIAFGEGQGPENPEFDFGLRRPALQNNPLSMKCELALISFLEILLHISNHPTLGFRASGKKLSEELRKIRPSLGFGLHIGWGIEGAIGSNHKIDASYLSPNVNIAARLMAATKQYGVSILVSGQVAENLSEEIKLLLRHVDTVNLKGSKMAIQLYTFDLLFQEGEICNQNKYACAFLSQKAKNGFEDYKLERRIFHNQLLRKRILPRDLLLNNPELAFRRSKFGANFDNMWQVGIEKYLDGVWPEAKSCFYRTLDMIPGHRDGPSRNLIDFMNSYSEVAPLDWKGVRKLVSK